MYKRKPRILFAGALAPLAEGWARRLGAEWIEARSVLCEGNEEAPHLRSAMTEAGLESVGPRPLSDEWLQWADLLVTLDADAARRCQSLPAHLQRKEWNLSFPREAETLDAVTEILRERVAGMIGGLRMMARSSE